MMVASYFSTNDTHSEKALLPQAGNKMLPVTNKVPTVGPLLTRSQQVASLAMMEASITNKLTEQMTTLIQPSQLQIKDIQTSDAQVAQTTDIVMELELAVQDTTRNLQKKEEGTMERLLMLQNQKRLYNLIFHSFLGKVGDASKRRTFMPNWLAMELQP